MLTSQDFKKIEKQAAELYGDLELEIIQEIAERIANVGYANTVVYNDVAILQEMGILYEDIIEMVAKYNATSASQIKEIFETAGVKSLKRDDTIYKLAGLNPKGLNESMVQLLSATARKTNNNLTRLTMTTANTSQEQFLNAMNKSYLEVSTGVKSYSQSILDVVKEISNQGAYIEYPTGQHRSIEAATRMNILTSVNQTTGKLQLMRAEEMNWDLMELSAHAGARPEHAEWQGKIVSRSGRKGYLSLDDIGYGEVTGFQGVNCRHTWFPYYEGSTLTYTDKELEQLKNEKVEYNGKKISKYEATQIQRKMERQIRQDKKDIAGLQGILTSGSKDDKLIEDTKTSLINVNNKLKNHNSIFNDFINQTNFKKDYNRLFVNSSKTIKEIVNTTPEYKNNLLKQQFKRYNKKELKQLAKETNIIIDKYTDNKSKWSGKLVILEHGIKDKNIRINCAKLWSCNILLHPEISPSMIMHEQIHAHSISYYSKKIYKENFKIEEATVQLLTKEICKKENIHYEKSQYESWVKSLEDINSIVKIKNTNMEFAKELIKISPAERIRYIENKANNISINDWIKLGKLLDKLR